MDQNPGITNIRRNGKAENVPDGLVLTVFLFLPFPYLADREGRSGFCKKVFQCIFKEFHGTFAGGLWIFMFDLIADTIWRRVFQFTDKKRPVMGITDCGATIQFPGFFQRRSKSVMVSAAM